MNKLEQLINEKMKSKSDFCRKAGISRPTLDYVLDRTRKPSLSTLKKICFVLKVDWKDYIDCI